MLFLSNELLTNYNCLCRKLKTVVLQARSETISTWELSADELHPPNVLPSVGIPTRFFLNMSKNYLIRINHSAWTRAPPLAPSSRDFRYSFSGSFLYAETRVDAFLSGRWWLWEFQGPNAPVKASLFPITRNRGWVISLPYNVDV